MTKSKPPESKRPTPPSPKTPETREKKPPPPPPGVADRGVSLHARESATESAAERPSEE